MSSTSIAHAPVRFVDIDVAKGIAIVLVVGGHLVARDIWPAGNDWYWDVHAALYTFHMAFFFYLAGYVFWTAAASSRMVRARNAMQRMLPAYMLLAVLVFFAKRSVASFLPVDRPIGSFWHEWMGFFFYPTEGFITFLWFVVALLGIYAATLLALKVFRQNFGLVLVLALILHLISVAGYVPKMFALHQMARFWLFFLLARWALEQREALLPFLRRSWWFWLTALLALLVTVAPKHLGTAAALLALPALHGLALVLSERARPARAVSLLGASSWPIYLMNVLAIGATKVLILKTVGWDGPKFFVVAPVLLLAGLGLPLLVQRHVLSRVAWLDRITR